MRQPQAFLDSFEVALLDTPADPDRPIPNLEMNRAQDFPRYNLRRIKRQDLKQEGHDRLLRNAQQQKESIPFRAVLRRRRPR
jgi:hypothetical protein